MLMPRTGSNPAAPGLALLAIVGLALASPARAQESTEGAEASPETTELEAPTGEIEAPAAAPSLPAPPPIMIVVLTSGTVPDALVSATQTALVDQVTAMAGRRPVHALGAQAIRDAVAACADDACIGAQLAQAGAQAGVIVRLRARPRRPLSASIELRDPVSGAPRLAAVQGELPLDPAQIPEAARALSEQLRAAMPPPPGTLLVTVDVDGARVQVDGHDIGTSPVAPVDVAEGPHEILVRMQGYLALRRQARVQPGQQARVDVTLQAMDLSAGGGGGGESGSEPIRVGGGGGDGEITGEWWFWAAIGGGAALIIAIAIGVGVAVASSGGPAQLDPNGVLLPPILGGL